MASPTQGFFGFSRVVVGHGGPAARSPRGSEPAVSPRVASFDESASSRNSPRAYDLHAGEDVASAAERWRADLYTLTDVTLRCLIQPLGVNLDPAMTSPLLVFNHSASE